MGFSDCSALDWDSTQGVVFSYFSGLIVLMYTSTPLVKRRYIYHMGDSRNSGPFSQKRDPENYPYGYMEP